MSADAPTGAAAEPPRADLVVGPAAGVVVVQVPAAFVADVAAAFEGQCARVLAAAGAHLSPIRVRALILDATDLVGYDSQGLSALRAVAALCRRLGIEIRQLGLPGRLATLLASIPAQSLGAER